ncbi:MAG: FABP family protein [Acidimicrobiales bacterium]|jgi:hypothetical protein|nr:FABP family protein [Acidimicrobiales bacterium]
MAEPLPSPPPHPLVAPLAGLLGVWVGAGHGGYPTIEPFDYTERVELTQAGKPFLAYSQRTRAAGSGAPLHVESGYLRVVGEAAAGVVPVELVVSQPSGIVEIHTGTFDGRELALRPVLVAGAPTAKAVTEVVRRFTLDGDLLRYTLEMAAVGQPLQWHLEAELRRTRA